MGPLCRVAVVGAGVGGSTLASILSRSPNIAVTVFERSARSADQGTGFDLDGESQRIVIDEAGIGKEAYLASSRPGSDAMRFFLSSGNDASAADPDPLAVMYVPRILRYFFPARPETNREQLRERLIEAAERCDWEFGAKVTSLCRGERPGSIQVIGKRISRADGKPNGLDGEDVSLGTFDVVVDASGFASPLRASRVVVTDADAGFRSSYTGRTMVHGVIDDPEGSLPGKALAMLGEGTAMIMGPRGRVLTLQRFGTGANGDNRASVYYFIKDANPDPGHLCDTLGLPRTSVFHERGSQPYGKAVDCVASDMLGTKWDGFLTGVMAAADRVAIRPVFQHPANPVFRQDAFDGGPDDLAVAVIGDALHVVPPSTGSGGNLAIMDASEAAKAIIKASEGDSGDTGSLLSALRKVEVDGMARAAEVLRETEEHQKRTMQLFESLDDVTGITARQVFGGSRVIAGVFGALKWMHNRGW